MSEKDSVPSWLLRRNSTLSIIEDLSLPLVPFEDCSSTRNYAATIIPPFYHTLSLLGIFGNVCSLVICLKPSRPWSIGSIGVLNLALCDLAYLASIPPRAIYVSENYDWSMGSSLCILSNILHFVGLTSSTMFICVVSTDRFLAIVFPLESRMVRTPRNAALVSLLLWAITVLLIYLSYPNINYRERKSGIRYCGTVVTSRFRYSAATYNLLSYYSVQVSVPLLLIIPSYVKIIARMRHSRQQWAAGNMQGRGYKTIWLIAVFIANFFVCWVPGQLLHIIACIIFFTLYDHTNTCRVANVVNLLVESSQLLYCLNAILDPFIFHIQEGLWELVSKALESVGCRVCWGNYAWSGKKHFGGPPSVSVVQLS
ncbi:type-1 angiotensin II receptor A-like [Oncorhynchus clarkii lewisi]|uniref:type-1 angiotensin II receptor A-like n=1 Tax=Oncorhynchus clarkii lewisi TaxID=490388 RepID=UPI0039B841B8